MSHRLGGTLVATNICKSHGSTPVLAGVSLVVRPRARIGVVGPNGIGKSTLLRILACALGRRSGACRARGDLAGAL